MTDQDKIRQEFKNELKGLAVDTLKDLVKYNYNPEYRLKAAELLWKIGNEL